MLQPTNHHRVPYTAGVTATAIARPGTAVGYMTPSGGLMGGVKTSLGCACDQAQANGTARLRAGPPVSEDYQVHEKGRLLGEAEALGALGEDPQAPPDDIAANAPASSTGLYALAALAAYLLFRGR